MEKTPLAVQLGQFVAALRFEDLPPAVVDKAKAVVNHAVTVAISAREQHGLRMLQLLGRAVDHDDVAVLELRFARRTHMLNSWPGGTLTSATWVPMCVTP